MIDAQKVMPIKPRNEKFGLGAFRNSTFHMNFTKNFDLEHELRICEIAAPAPAAIVVSPTFPLLISAASPSIFPRK